MEMVDHLCDFCVQALTIDDSLGSLKKTCEGTVALDVVTFELNDWRERPKNGLQVVRSLHPDRDESGWTLIVSDSGRDTHNRYVCAGQHIEKVVAPFALSERLEPTDQKCRFCARLEELFQEHYNQCTWWNDPVSLLRIRIQYEWTVVRATLYGKELSETSESEKWTYENSEHDVRRPPWGEGLEAKPWEKTQKMTSLAVFVNHPGHENAEWADLFSFDVAAGPGRCRDWLKIQYNSPDPAGPFSNENLEITKKRIDECINNHPNLNQKLRKAPVFPTRVLDIGDDGHVRLVESKLLLRNFAGHHFRYAALSYCWGSPDDAKCMTTTKTQKTYEVQGISERDMPATFLDALFITRKLRIRYLWIDALCIIQDDSRDWDLESSRMSDVFANSYLTICAAASSSSSENFLVQSPSETLTVRFCSSLDPNISGIYSILLEGQKSQLSVADSDIWGQRWLTRGWTWQEEIMSTRLLIFGKNKVQFRCHGKAIMESGIMQRLAPPRSVQGILDFSDWHNSVRAYSRRKLTFSRDRLSAIAGVAKCFNDWTEMQGKQTKYLAGLWVNEEIFPSLEDELRWVCDPGPTVSYTEMMAMLTDQNEYCAPSWSWASRMTGVDHLLGDSRMSTVFEVSSHDVQAAVSDAVVRTKFGSSITLRGKIVQTPVIPSSGELVAGGARYSNRWATRGDFGSIVFWLDWIPNTEDSEEQKRQSQLQLFFTTAPRDFEPEPMRQIKTGGLLLLPHAKSPFDYRVGGLLLLPHAKSSCYYRVGAFEYQTDRNRLKSIRESEFRTVKIV